VKIVKGTWYGLREQYPVKVWQWIGVSGSVLLLIFAGGCGIVQYWGQQQAQQDRENERIAYAAELASYENARDERLQCEQEVEFNNSMRDVFIGIFDVLEAASDGTSPLIAQLQANLDSNSPLRNIDECPSVPKEPDNPQEG